MRASPDMPQRYELTVLVGPCSEAEEEALMEAIAELPECQAIGGCVASHPYVSELKQGHRRAGAMAKRSRRLAARLWWATLPYAGWVGWSDDAGGNPAPWYAYPLAWLNGLAERLPGSAPFEPLPAIVCDCDYCRGVPGAVFEP